MTIRDGSISFNNACISALDNVMQIETFFNDKLKRFALTTPKLWPEASDNIRWLIKDSNSSAFKTSDS